MLRPTPSDKNLDYRYSKTIYRYLRRSRKLESQIYAIAEHPATLREHHQIFRRYHRSFLKKSTPALKRGKNHPLVNKEKSVLGWARTKFSILKLVRNTYTFRKKSVIEGTLEKKGKKSTPWWTGKKSPSNPTSMTPLSI